MMQRAMVVGGNGFIGSALVKRLRAEGVDVGVITNNHRPLPAAVSVFLIDIRNKDQVYDAFQSFPADMVYFLARPPESEIRAEPMLDCGVTVEGAMNVGCAALGAGAHTLIWASSAMVYKNESRRMSEDEPGWIGPIDVYGLSKVLLERVAHFLGNAIICRFFNVYGPGEFEEHVITRIVREIKAGKDVITLGNTEPERDFIYVDDVAEALYRLGKKGAWRDPTTINIGTGTSRSILDVIRTINALTGKDIHVVVDPTRVRGNERPRLVADTHMFEWVFRDFKPRGLEDGLYAMLQAEGLL